MYYTTTSSTQTYTIPAYPGRVDWSFEDEIYDESEELDAFLEEFVGGGDHE